MNTWLPYPDYLESARVLDPATLVDQPNQVLAILDVIHESDTSIYRGAPDQVVNMWRDHEAQLCEYGLTMVEQCLQGPSEFTNLARVKENLEWHLDCATSGEYSMDKPKWFGDLDFHDSHKAALLRTMPEFYRDKFDVDRTLPLIWPVA